MHVGGVNLADHFIINIPKTKYIFEILGGGGAFPIIMYEYLIGIFIFCFMDDIIPILRNSTFLITSIILWSIYYYVYSYTGILPQFGETHNAVFGITLPWIVMGIAYKFNIRFKYAHFIRNLPVPYAHNSIVNRLYAKK